MIGRTNASYGKADNPFIATSNEQMAKYLNKKYVDCFVRMDYDKYRITTPLSLDYTSCNFITTIGPSRMLEYVKKWLGKDNKRCVLSLKGKTIKDSETKSGYYTLDFWACKGKNANGTYGYALALQIATHTIESGVESGFYQGNVFVFGSNLYEGTVLLELEEPGYTNSAHIKMDETILGSKWGYANISEINTTYLPLVSGALSEGGAAPCTWVTVYDDALVLTNSLGLESDDKYVEGGVYKVTAQYNEINTYVAESPLQVGDQLAGATVYLNQQITSGEFEAMCDELAKTTDFGMFENIFIFANVDYPTVEPEDEAAMAAFYTPMALFLAQQNIYSQGPSSQKQKYWQLASYSMLSDNGDVPTILGKKATANSLVPVSPATPANFTVATSLTLPDLGTLTVPATITKINFPTLLNAIAGKTANFYKKTVLETSYSFEPQIASGSVEEVSSAIALNNKVIDECIGNVYKYTGTDESKYKKESLYIIMED